MEKVTCCNILNNYDKMYLKIKKEGTLLDLRNALEKRRHFNLLYFLKSNGNYFSREEEKTFIIKPSENIIINFTDVNTMKINLDNKYICDINIENISLTKLRIILGTKIIHQHKFLFNNAFILDEENFKVFEICKNNVVEINTISKELFDSLKKEEIFKDKEINSSKDLDNNKREKINTEENETNLVFNNLKNYKKEPFKLIPNQDYCNINEKENKNKKKTNIMIHSKFSNNIKRNKSIDPNKIKEKKYILKFNGEIKEDFPYIQCSPDTSLSEIRKMLPSHYKSYIFLYEGYRIGNEETTNISHIENNNYIYLKNDKIISLNKIISGCKKLTKNSIYDYYLYPNFKFNEEDEKRCISLLLLGETGAGKTTFLNSLINFILKVDYNDNFRYVLVNEKGAEEFLSQTKEVSIYYIKSHYSNPPIKIIDTPGFGDTSGYDFDKKITRMIYEKFKEIKDLNSVCFICKYNEERFDYSQRYIFNSVINLFAKDMAKNFMILFSFCDIGKIISKKCFEEADSPFYILIKKIKEPWYLKFNNSGFFAEKKNALIEQFFKMGNESFIKLLNKLKSLKKIKLELSSDVNIKRDKLDNIISYIQKKLINLPDFNQMSFYSYSLESPPIYYCNECKFFSDSDECIICKKHLNTDFFYNYCKLFNHPEEKGNSLLKTKYFLEIYSNLFQLENLMIEYNNITLKNSHETLIEFLKQIQNENSKINDIIIKYKEFRDGFYKQKNKQEEFALYLFNQLILNKTIFLSIIEK